MKRIILALVVLLALAGSARAQEGRYETIEFNSAGRFLAGVNVAVCTTLATTAASVTNNIATLTMASNPQTAGFLVGFSLTVSGFTGADTYFNTTATIVAVSSTTISYTLVHANGSATSNGIVYMTGSTTQACAPLATLFTDNTGSFTSPNPFVSDGLGNVGIWAAAGPYYIQTYGPTVITSIKLIGIGCVPSSSVGGCGVTLAGNNAWTGIETHAGTETFKYFNTVRYAFQFLGGDFGAQVNAAIADLPVVSSYSVGTISLLGFPQAQTQTTGVTIASPYVGVQGPGQGLLKVTCSINSDCWRINANPFSTTDALGIVGGFTLIGTGTANGVGVHLGDIIGERLQDMHIQGFTGANGAALWFDNVTNFTERSTLLNVWLDNSTKLWRFTNTNGASTSASFGYTRALDVKMNVLAAQTGISFESGILYGGALFVNANQTNTSTTIAVSGSQYTGGPSAGLFRNNYDVVAECTLCTGGTLLNVASGNCIEGTGILDGSGGALTNTLAGTGCGGVAPVILHAAQSNPAVTLDTNNSDLIFGPVGTATSGANFSSRKAIWQASIWNGSAAVPDTDTCQNVVPSGANPTTTLTCTHAGSSGTSQADFSQIANFGVNNLFIGCAPGTSSCPQFNRNAGTVSGISGALYAVQNSSVAFLQAVDNSGNMGLAGGIALGGHANQSVTGKYAGTCVFAAGTTCSITYSTAFVSAPILVFSPVNPGAVTFTLTSSTNSAFTITASGVNSLTINWIAIGNPN